MRVNGRVMIYYQAVSARRGAVDRNNLPAIERVCRELSERTQQVENLKISVGWILQYDGRAPGRYIHAKMIGTEYLSASLRNAGIHDIEFVGPQRVEEVEEVMYILLTRSLDEAKKLLQGKSFNFLVYDPKFTVKRTWQA